MVRCTRFQLVGKLDGPHGIQVSIFENEFKIWWYYWTSTTEHDQNEFDLISIRLKSPLIDHCPFSGESVGPNFSKKKKFRLFLIVEQIHMK